jgi:zeta-carotene isomerase
VSPLSALKNDNETKNDSSGSPAARVVDMVLGRGDDGAASNLEFGEDAAYFSLEAQKASSWALFFGLLTGVMGLLYVVWIDPSHGLGSSFTGAISSVAPNSEVAILEILFVFAVVHSGLAYLRPYGEDLVGARAYRVMFALISLPLAAAAVFYFINHRYDGTALWNIRDVPGVHSAVWAASFLSFYLLYPSTFNILEVAAVDEPKLHMYESGITRITRHPQAFGQLIWCMAHTAWIGSSFMVATSLGLMAHHAFACWHGDFRLKRKYGDAFEGLKERTSIIPFAAILDGRQKLPKDFWKEFVRLPYAFLVPFCVGAYVAHPYMQQVAYWLKY